MCEQELVKSRLRVNAANVSVRKFLVTVCVWLSSSWDLRLSAQTGWSYSGAWPHCQRCEQPPNTAAAASVVTATVVTVS